MKRHLTLTLIMVICAMLAKAQDPQFSQYYQSPIYLNPGFTGLTPHQRVCTNYRVQWPNLPKAFSTYSASYDVFKQDLRSGFGLLFMYDNMGSSTWKTTTAAFNYSYKIKLSSKVVFSPGISFGYGANGLDRSKLSLRDGLEYDGVTLDPDINKLSNHSYFDLGSGFLIYSKKYWIGGSFMHMNRPNLSVLNDVSRLPMKVSVHGGMRVNLNNGPKSTRQSYLTPSFNYRVQGATFSQLDIGLNYHVDPISVGIWYRGKPFKKNVIGQVYNDAMIFSLGTYFKDFSVSYSYDFTISSLQPSSGGAHEISIVFEFSTKQKEDKKKYKLIPCPVFNSRPGFWN